MRSPSPRFCPEVFNIPGELRQGVLSMLRRFDGPDGRVPLVESLRTQPIIGVGSDLAELVGVAVGVEAFEPGSVLIEESATDNDIFFILTGVVSIRVLGREVAVRNAGQHVGEVALILSPDDAVTSRDATTAAPRDNITFELGLFMGALGHSRTFLIYPRGIDMKIPTDLTGITPLTYTQGAGDELPAAIASACNAMRTIIRSSGPR